MLVNNGSQTLLDGGHFTTGLSGSVVMDIEAQVVESFSVSITPNTFIEFCGGCTYAGQSSVTIASASISSSDPFTGSAAALVAGLFTFTGNDAEVAGNYSVGGGPLTPISYPGTAIEFLVNSGSVVVVSGQNLGVIDGTAFGEAEALTIATNLTMILGSPVAIPEPGTALLLLLGLGALARARR